MQLERTHGLKAANPFTGQRIGMRFKGHSPLWDETETDPVFAYTSKLGPLCLQLSLPLLALTTYCITLLYNSNPDYTIYPVRRSSHRTEHHIHSNYAPLQTINTIDINLRPIRY